MHFRIRGFMSLVVRVVIATAIASLLARRGLKKRSLDASGAAAAFVVGFLSMAAGLRFGALLIGFYFSGSKLTTLKATVKLALDENYKVGGQRSARQVLACSLIGTIVAIYHQFVFGSGDLGAIDFATAPLQSALFAAYIGHYACCAADTWASELGVLSPSDPILITTFRHVPPGTNGGISLVGTVASAAGGLFIGALYVIMTLLTGNTLQLAVLVLGTSAGLIGSLLDSLLGATMQATWYNRQTKKICAQDARGPKAAHANVDIVHICGRDILTNEQVNAVSVVLTTLISTFLARGLF